MQESCSTFSSCYNAGFSSTNKFFKTLFFRGMLLFLVFSQGALYSQSTKPSANLDQIRNGSKTSPVSPANWVNGNAGASQAHYAEGWSIPYRMLLENLSTSGSHELVIEWDITHSSKNALDYITSYDNIDNPPGSHVGTFGHAQETINPTIGITGLGSATTFPIPAPGSVGSPVAGMPTTSFNNLPAAKRNLTIYNGTITGAVYLSQGNYDAQSQTRMKITFTATNSKVLIAWGGHIAAEYDWGAGNGATAVSGSPYHTRLISIDNSGGNQDRSLAAAAVAPPPPSCTITPSSSTICAGGSAEFSGPPGLSTYTWSISPTGPTLTTSGTNGQTVTVTGATVANSPYTLTLVTSYFGGITSTETCTATLNVNETSAPSVTYNPPACDESTFSITVTGVISGAVYTVKDKDGGTIMNISPSSPYTAQDTNDITFTNIPAGSGYQVTASVSSCESSATSCGTSSVQALKLNPDTKTTEKIALIDAKTANSGFDAYPVPFKDQLTIKYKFDYVSDVKIEVFNSRGTLVLTKNDTNVYLNKEIALDLKLNRGKEQMYVVKVTTNRGSTSKKVMSSK